MVLVVIAALAAGCGEVALRTTAPATGSVASPASLLAGSNIGDGGPISQASLEGPQALSVGPSGEVYVADRFRVRRLDPAAGASTLKPTGPGLTVSSPGGVAAAADGTVYFTDQSTGGLFRTTSPAVTAQRINAAANLQLASESDNIPLRSAKLTGPSRLALDHAGNLLVAESGSERLRLVERTSDPNPDRALRIRTVAGTPATSGFSGDGFPATAAKLCNPLGMVVDLSGSILFADSGNQRVRRVGSTDGTITTAAGTGSACGSTGGFNGDGLAPAASLLNRPSDVTLDASSRLLIADTTNFRVRAVDPMSGTLVTVAGNGGRAFTGDGGAATAAALGLPTAIAGLSDGSFLVADRINNRIRRVDSSGNVSTFAGAPGGVGESLTAARLSRVTALAVDSSNRLLFADSASVFRALLSTGPVELVAGNGLGGYSGDGGAATAARIRPAAGLAVDAAGNIYFSDLEGSVVRRVDAVAHHITTIAGTTATTAFVGDGGEATLAGLFHPRGLAADAQGNLYIADEGHHAVRVVDRFGVIFTAANTSGTPGFSGDGGDARAAKLFAPRAVAIEPASGNLYIADTGNHAIRMVFLDGSSKNGTITSTATGVPLTAPAGVVWDHGGNLAVLDVDSTKKRFRPILVSSPASSGTTAAAGRDLPLNGLVEPDFSEPSAPPDASIAISNDGRVLVSDGKRIVATGF